MSCQALLCAIWRNRKQRIRIYLAILTFWCITISIIYSRVNSLTDYLNRDQNENQVFEQKLEEKNIAGNQGVEDLTILKTDAYLISARVSIKDSDQYENEVLEPKLGEKDVAGNQIVKDSTILKTDAYVISTRESEKDRLDAIQLTNLQTMVNNLPYNIIFLKTHETGSSAVTNVMQRFAKTKSLKAALPRCDHGFCYPKKFDNTLLYLHTESNSYNILFNHAVFHKENMLKIMESKKATKIITIIREPYSQFDSIVQNIDFINFFKLNANASLLDSFFKDSDEILKNFIQSSRPSEEMSEAYFLSKNPNAFDMGFNVWNESPEYIKEVLDSIKQDFHLVMIMEHMEESLVLLKNELRCKLEDVVFYLHNERKEKNAADSQRMRKRVSSWNKMDATIYSYFNKTFWDKIKNLDASFHSDVKKLREYNQHLTDHCKLSKMTELSVSLMREYQKKTGTTFCFDFLAEDLLFTNRFKNTLLWEKMSANATQNKLI